MTLSTPQRLGIFAILALIMAATRINHFGAFPDASWALFFIAGFYLRGSMRWAFTLLIALAVFVDFLVISGQGLDFWSHYCVSPAYWFLLPAYAGLWIGGSWLRERYVTANIRTAGWLAASLLVATTLCYLLTNGSFYWLSATVPARSFEGWLKNLGDWYLPYLQTTSIYVAIATLVHMIGVLLVRALDLQPRPTAPRG